MDPTDHQLLAAVRVARAVDITGNTAEDLYATYALVLTQGEHRREALLQGEQLLAELGILHMGDGRSVKGSPRLTVLAKLQDSEAVAYLRRLLARRIDEDVRAAVGFAGEVAVVTACRAELRGFDRPDLAEAVQQVSLLDDSLGYDIRAPRIDDDMRLLEVKTSASPLSSLFEFFLTRNEYEVGRHRADSWSLVACSRDESANDTQILGWCRVDALRPYLPDDRNGRWTEARVRVPRTIFFEGIPSAV